MKVSLKPKYFPLIQKPVTCNVTCLQMILMRRKQKLFTQDELAYEMSFTVPKKYLAYYSTPLKEADKEWSLNFWLELAEERVNKFFGKHKIPLVAKVYFKSKIKDVTKFIIDMLKQNNDIWTMSANKPMYGKGKGGHDILVESYDSETKEVGVVDPQPEHIQKRQVELNKLFEAMDKKWGRERGFVIIKRKKK